MVERTQAIASLDVNPKAVVAVVKQLTTLDNSVSKMLTSFPLPSLPNR